MAMKNRRVVTERRRSASSGLVNLRSSSRAPLKLIAMRVNSGTNRTVAMRFTRFAYSSFVTEERVEGSVLLDFFVTLLFTPMFYFQRCSRAHFVRFIKKESLSLHKNMLSIGCPIVEVKKGTLFLLQLVYLFSLIFLNWV
jgi:hypothetical protein